MTRRWLIRTLFMLPIVLCLGGWPESYTHWTYLHYNTDRYTYNIASAAGSLYYYSNDGRLGVYVRGWQFERSAPGPVVRPPTAVFFCFGFGYGYNSYSTFDQHWICIPYYFFIVIFSATLLFVWRKTRPKPDPKTAFPVEVNEQKE